MVPYKFSSKNTLDCFYATYAFIEMVIYYSSSQDMFNELTGESWLEDESFK